MNNNAKFMWLICFLVSCAIFLGIIMNDVARIRISLDDNVQRPN